MQTKYEVITSNTKRTPQNYNVTHSWRVRISDNDDVSTTRCIIHAANYDNIHQKDERLHRVQCSS